MSKLLGGRYQLIRVIGSGEQGKTYLMADVHHPGHPKCIVKHIKLPSKNPTTLKFISSFLKKKIDILAKIGKHDRIPRTLAYFEENQDFYIVQEYVPGRSLETELVPGRPLPEGHVVQILRDVLEVLAFAQEHGVIHRCIKPSNILRRHSDQRLMLIDFGIVKEVNLSMMTSGNEVTEGGIYHNGQMAYVPAEQLHGQPQFSSDHYALGMLAIQALTGLTTAELPDAEQVSQKGVIHLLSKDHLNISPDLIGIINRMVHPSSTLRYQKAINILAELRTLGIEPATQAIEATHPDSPLPEQGRQRWPWIVAIGIGVGALTLLGLVQMRLPQRGLALWLMRSEARETVSHSPEQAIEHYSRILQLNSQVADAYVQRGLAYDQMGNSELALDDLSQAISLAPNQAQIPYQRGNIRFGLGDLQGAIEDYTTALRLDADYIQAYVNRGSARAEWGDDQGAVEDYTQAIERNPGHDILAAAYLNRCLSQSNLGDQLKALEDCSASINLRPNHSLAYQNRGLVRRRLGDLQGSMQDYNIAIRIAPESPDAYYNRGLTRQELGDYSGAIDDYSKAIEIEPTHPFAYYDRGLAYAHLGQTPAAIRDLQTTASQCLDLGRLGCYKDAQYQLELLNPSPPAAN